jgi:hypothetical protein
MHSILPEHLDRKSTPAPVGRFLGDKVQLFPIVSQWLAFSHAPQDYLGSQIPTLLKQQLTRSTLHSLRAVGVRRKRNHDRADQQFFGSYPVPLSQRHRGQSSRACRDLRSQQSHIKLTSDTVTASFLL